MNGEITDLLRRAGCGERPAFDALMPLIYGELHRLAHAHRAREGNTLDTTALVHEAYLKLAGADGLSWPDRRHFFAYAAKAMRSIMLDDARRKLSDKRDGGVRCEDSVLETLPMHGSHAELIAVDQALDRLAGVSARLREVAELHVFAGLEFRDIAACLELTERTVFRDWRKARMLLQSMLVAADA